MHLARLVHRNTCTDESIDIWWCTIAKTCTLPCNLFICITIFGEGWNITWRSSCSRSRLSIITIKNIFSIVNDNKSLRDAYDLLIDKQILISHWLSTADWHCMKLLHLGKVNEQAEFNLSLFCTSFTRILAVFGIAALCCSVKWMFPQSLSVVHVQFGSHRTVWAHRFLSSVLCLEGSHQWRHYSHIPPSTVSLFTSNGVSPNTKLKPLTQLFFFFILWMVDKISTFTRNQ